MPSLRLILGMSPGRTVLSFWPSSVTTPFVGRSIIASSFSSVLLPAPECPVTKAISPASTWNDTSVRAW